MQHRPRCHPPRSITPNRGIIRVGVESNLAVHVGVSSFLGG